MKLIAQEKRKRDEREPDKELEDIPRQIRKLD